MGVCEERRKNILSYIEKNKHMAIEELANIFNVNEQVIYRDLIYLEKINKIERTTKGAIFPESRIKKKALTLLYRETLYYKEKELIAKFATSLIKDGESLMIDGGSTTLLFASNLINKKRLMVITNTSTIGDVVKKENKKNRVILTGGELSRNTYATTGEMTTSIINQHRVNKAVLGVCAIDAKKGIFYTTIEEEAIVKQNMINAANEIIILADSSKINIKKPYKVFDATLKKKITLVTDKNINEKDIKKFEKYNIKVLAI